MQTPIKYRIVGLEEATMDTPVLDRHMLVPDLLHLESIAHYLSDVYEIKPQIDTDEFWETFYSSVPEAFALLLDHRSELVKSNNQSYKKLNNEFYDGMATQPAMGLVHSMQYNFIFDTIALSMSLSAVLRPRRILDIGCNSGYLANWLSLANGIDVVGVDPSVESINTANRIAKQLKSNATFAVGTHDSISINEKFDMIISAKSTIDPFNNRTKWRKWFERSLTPGGYLLLIGEEVNDALSTGKSLNLSHDLSVIHAELIGGHVFNCWDSDLALVYKYKGGDRRDTQRIVQEARLWWDKTFAPAMNDVTKPTPIGQRNQAWMRYRHYNKRSTT